MFHDEAGGRWASPENLLLAGFAVVLAWAPFPYGSNRFWGELVLGLALGGVLLAWSGAVLAGSVGVTSLTKRLLAPALCFALALGWAGLQTLDLNQLAAQTGLDFAAFAHPIWSMMTPAIGAKSGAYISVDPERSRQAIFTASVCVAAFFLAFALSRDRGRAARLMAVLVAIGAAYSAMALAELFLHVDFHSWIMPDPKPQTGRLSGPFINPNHFATFIAICSLASLGMFVETLREAVVWDRGGRILTRTAVQAFTGPASGWLIAVLILLSSLLLTQSRGGVLAFLIATLALIISLTLGRRLDRTEAPGRRAMAAFLFLVVGGAAAISVDPILGRVEEQGLENSARASLSNSMLKAIETAPLVGHGFGAFQSYYPRFADGSLTGDVDEAHNDVLETLADLGLPAGLAFMAAPALLAGMCLAGCLRRRRDRVYPAIGFAASIAVGAHAFADFSLQIPAVAATYAAVLGIGVAQSWRTGSDLVR